MKSWRIRAPRSNGQRGKRRNWKIKTKGEENFKGVTDLTNFKGDHERLGQKSADLIKQLRRHCEEHGKSIFRRDLGRRQRIDYIVLWSYMVVMKMQKCVIRLSLLRILVINGRRAVNQ